MAQEITKNLNWVGGLHTALAPGLIEDGELQDGNNFLCRDGEAKLDRRYIQAYDQHAQAVGTAWGSGWGKFGTGTLSNQYVAVIQEAGQSTCFLYEYDLSQSSLSRHFAAGQLSTGNWFWQQFANYLYGVNATDGMGRKLIGAGNNGHGDFSVLRIPAAPLTAPTAPQNSSANVSHSFTGATIAATGTPTTAAVQSDGSILCVWPSGGAGTQTVTVTFTTSPDRRPDWSYHDTIYQNVYGTTGMILSSLNVISTTNSGGTLAAPWIDGSLAGGLPSFPTLMWRVNNIARTNRAQVTQVVYTAQVPSNGGQLRLRPLFSAGVWLSLGEQASIPLNTEPTLQVLQYEYTYCDPGTGFESAPSPQLLIPASQQYHLGEWRTVTPVVFGATPKIRIYRRVESGGAITRYRLAELPNTGTQTWVDKLAVDELIALPTLTPSTLPSTGITAITAWLNRMVIAVGAQVYISRDDNPIAFTQSGVIFDPSDEGRAVTFYPDDKQAEQVQCLIAQDALYIVTDQSVRCLFGTTPDNWRLIKIEGAEGAVGPRAACGYKNGVLVLTPSGRLMYYGLGVSSTYSVAGVPRGIEVSAKVRAKVGNLGIKALATSDATITVRPDGEIEIRNQTGAYFVQDTDGNWRKGTHTNPTHSTLFVTGLPLRWIGVNGYLYQGGDDSYVTDGGLNGTSGTPVFFYVTPKEERVTRSQLTNVYIRSPQTLSNVDGANIVLYPGFTPTTRINADSPTRYTPSLSVLVNEKRNKSMPAGLIGEEFSVKLDGDATTVFQEVRVSFEAAGTGRNL